MYISGIKKPNFSQGDKMSTNPNKNNTPKNTSRSWWIIGCSLGVVLALCLGVFLVLGSLSGIQRVFGGRSENLNVELIKPTSPVIVESNFSLFVTLSNMGTQNITVSEIRLPEELAELATLINVSPPNTLSKKDGNPGHYSLNLLIAPEGQQTLEFSFKAIQAGEIRGDIIVYIGKKSTISALEINVSPKPISMEATEEQTPVLPDENIEINVEEILVDEFNDDTNNWEVGEFEGANIDITNGKMVMDVFTDNLWAYSIMLENIYGSVNLSVNVEIVNPSKGGNIGLICGFQDENNFSAVEIKPDGYYSIWVFDQNRYIVLVDWTFSEAITSKEVYSIGADCTSDKLSLLVDDIVLVSAVPPNYLGGKVGLIAGTELNYPLTVGFDNFTVIEP
jgi:hypothetical protein